MREHLGGVEEEDLGPAAARFVGQGLRDVTLPDPSRAVNRGVLVALDEGARGEIEELGLVELGPSRTTATATSRFSAVRLGAAARMS